MEDDDFVGRAYKDGLQRAGFEVDTATDGIEALKKAKNAHHDIIILDLVMPLKNGFEVLAQYGIDGSKFSELETERILTIAKKNSYA